MEGQAADVGFGPVPDSLTAGEATFTESCSSCHGQAAVGTDSGPTLVHSVYAPNHHADYAFVRAVEFGVRAHHWTFGDMPPVEGLDRLEVLAIVEYVRWLQREAGIE